MGKSTLWENFTMWLASLPIAFAYRLVWAVRKTRAGRPVYEAMWDAELALPSPPDKAQGERK